MDYVFLPDKIKKLLDDTSNTTEAIAIIRTSGNIDGDSGEGYIVSYPDKLFTFSRGFGENDFQMENGSFDKDINSISIAEEGYDSVLRIDMNGKSFAPKFSSFEKSTITPILENWQKFKKNKTSEPPSIPENDKKQVSAPPPIHEKSNEKAKISADRKKTDDLSSKTNNGKVKIPPININKRFNEKPVLSPMEGLAAALFYMSKTDNKMDAVEGDYIKRICGGDKKLFKNALEYYRKNNFKYLMRDLGYIDEDQKLCILANLIEIAMTDGVLHRTERDIIHKFVREMNIAESDYKKLFDVLLVKNQVSILEN